VVPYTTILYLVKAAVIAWYYCITPSTFTRCRIALNIISVTCVVSFLVTLGFNGLSCYPVPRNWSLDADKLCVSSAQYSTFFISFGAHICTDIAIFCYPFSLLKSIRRRLQHTRIRWGIIFLFLLGFLAIISTCARVIAVSLEYVPLLHQEPLKPRVLTNIPQLHSPHRRPCNHHRVHRQHPHRLLPNFARLVAVAAGIPPSHHRWRQTLR
jgi:hypothetical protein